MIACPLPVIALKCTGVPITQPEEIIFMYKSFLFFSKKIKIFLLLIKPFSILISKFQNFKKKNVIKWDEQHWGFRSLF
jgi:hypothetical protein